MTKSNKRMNKRQRSGSYFGGEDVNEEIKPVVQSSRTPIILVAFVSVLLYYIVTLLDDSAAPYSSEADNFQNWPSRAPKEMPRVVSNGKNDFEGGVSDFDNYVDPNMKMMNFTIPGETKERSFLAYVTPHVSTFYHNTAKKNRSTMKIPHFTGLSGKFINMSREKLILFWDDGHGNSVYIATALPFDAVSTATFPGHKFFFAPESNSSDKRFQAIIQPNKNLYVYDPYENKDLDMLTEKQKRKYHVQRVNHEFSKQYKSFTGREWLSLYPNRREPRHKMWNADYFGQEHYVATPETQFIKAPPHHEIQPLSEGQYFRKLLDSDPRPLHQYRSPEPILNMTMTVLSCAPRVFEIKNFLSDYEVDHIVHMATGLQLSLSSTVTNKDAKGRPTTNSNTRTSRNSWVPRHTSPIVDSIYRRAADLMRIDEALFRGRTESERSDYVSKQPIAENLQLVHYDRGQQYTPHHDFSHPSQTTVGQPVRFGTILVYLNEGMSGGMTSFPRWMNAETQSPMRIKPEIGKAILFYSLLPDGNMDDLSQHAAEPVIDGEKWLINLWTWDPVFEVNNR